MSAVLIGFDLGTGEVFESRGSGQCHVLPRGVTFTPAQLAIDESLPVRLPAALFPIEDHDLYFREDSYDPVTRIRRGRFYERGQSSHIRFYVSPSAIDIRSVPGLYSLLKGRLPVQLARARVHLGLIDMNSSWRVLQAEPITTGEILVTLKAVAYLGILPDLDESRIPDGFRTHITEKVDKLVDNFQVAAPSATIELARDAASAIMSAVVIEGELSGRLRDLSESANIYSEYCGIEKKSAHYNVVHCAKILANLHNQNKSVEQLKNEYRPIIESDAELAVRCLGQMLRDFGWVRV